jgi:hypothetical protein
MSTDSILTHPAVKSLKQKALALLASGPPGPQAGEGEQDGWRFPQAWNLAWKQNPDLQNQVMATGYVLLPQVDKTIEYVAPGADTSWYGGAPNSVSGEFRQTIKRQNDELMQVVQARQRASGSSFDECWREVLAERPDLKQGGSAGFLATPQSI